MPRLRAVVFDLDDTLYPEREYVRSGFHAVAAWSEEHLGISADDAFAQLDRLFEQGVRGDTFNRWLEANGKGPDETVEVLVNVYRDHDPTIVPHDGVQPLLERLGQRYLLGLVSDGAPEIQARKLARLGLAKHFGSVVFPTNRAEWKPSPDSLKKALTALGVSGPEAVYVADNPAKDFLGARSAAMRSIRVRDTRGLHARAEPPSPEHAPDDEIPRLSELESLLTRLEEST